VQGFIVLGISFEPIPKLRILVFAALIPDVGGIAKVECWSEQKWNPRGASKSGRGVDGDGWFPR
jgi:hypothetical protein